MLVLDALGVAGIEQILMDRGVRNAGALVLERLRGIVEAEHVIAQFGQELGLIVLLDGVGKKQDDPHRRTAQKSCVPSSGPRQVISNAGSSAANSACVEPFSRAPSLWPGMGCHSPTHIGI